MKKKNLAFTLAEVLIVIGIIGVVAALTLPNLNHATGDKETVTKVKKIYAALTDAVDRAQVVYGDFNTWFGGLSTDADKNERAAKRITEFMKVSKDCGFDEGCFSNAPLYGADNQLWNGDCGDSYLECLQSASSYMVTLADGTSLAFQYGENNRIRVDIDGPNKGKNQYGRDIFEFCIGSWGGDFQTTYNQLITDNESRLANPNTIYNSPSANAATWIIENGNLDYLKCPDELNWETKTSCE